MYEEEGLEEVLGEIAYSFETFDRMGGEWRKMYVLGCVILIEEV
jgi:hypothetical protein